MQRWKASIRTGATFPLAFSWKTSQWPGGKGATAALAPARTLSSVSPVRGQRPIRGQDEGGGARRRPLATFRLGAEAQEAVLGEDSEQRPDSEGVPAHAHRSAGRVQQDESKDAVQQGRHLLGSEAVVEVEQHLPVHLRLVLEAKLLPQLEEATAVKTLSTPPFPSPAPPTPALTARWL